MALKWLFGGGGKDAAKGPPPDYEKAKKIAAGSDPKAKAKLASNPALQPEFLYFFASDEDTNVRSAVAKNAGTPMQADVILARDPSAEVKIDLAKKVGRLLPGLSQEENRKVTEMVLQVVETLAEDSDMKVRATISNQVKSIDTIPPRIAQRLAKDAEEVVATPVLEFSPLLTDEDLTAIIASGCRGHALAAMARRKSLTEQVSTSIADTQDPIALPDLLANADAQLSQKVLAAAVEAAEDKPEWQKALAGRSDLNKGLLRRMASFVGKSTLDKLIDNNVLVDDALERELRDTVAQAQAAQDGDDENDKAHEEEMRAKELFDKGELNIKTMMKAVEKGEREFVIHALSLLGEANSNDVRRLLNGRDPKLPISISWHCNLGIMFAAALEKNLMELSDPLPKGQSGSYPMSEDDMAWTLEVAGIL